jgi:iron complex outermembrane receptor protein
MTNLGLPPARETPSPRRVVAAVSHPASPTPAGAPAAREPAAPAASQGPASDGGPGALPKPPGQTITTVSGERIKDAPAFTVEDLLQESPGVSFKQGNGPRDIGISIRGSNARNTFGIRNIVVLEDGFSVTQPDGLSRTDLLDPHAYGAVDIYRGPSSAMFGNYATGGAINFRRKGGAILRPCPVQRARDDLSTTRSRRRDALCESHVALLTWRRLCGTAQLRCGHG